MAVITPTKSLIMEVPGAANDLFLLHVAAHSLHIRLMWKCKKQRPRRSRLIPNIIPRRTQLLAVIIYIIKISIYFIILDIYILYYLDIEHQDSHRSTRSVVEYL